jgi:hypothetical protein
MAVLYREAICSAYIILREIYLRFTYLYYVTYLLYVLWKEREIHNPSLSSLYNGLVTTVPDLCPLSRGRNHYNLV